MPNGNPNFETEELPLLEMFFAKISSVLESFSDDHNLLIEKYYHDGPAWTFKFRHPVDGVGQIEVQKCDNDTVLIGYGWYIDDYDTSTRFLKYPSPKKIGLDHTDLRKALENSLSEILQSKRDGLVAHKAPYPWSKRCSKEEFYKQYERLPNLRVKDK